MTDYAKNRKRDNMMFENIIKRGDLMKKVTHVVESTKEKSKVTWKPKSYKDSRLPGNNGIGNPFRPSPDKRLLINIQKTEDKKVKKIPFIMSEPRAICDIDKDFYKLVNGRPIRSFYIDHKQYLRDLTEITIDRVNTAYVKDLIFQFENSRHTFEGKEYQKAMELYDKINEQFRHFLEDSWESVKIANAKADAKYEELQAVLDYYDTYNYELATKKYEINKLCNVLSNLDKFREFLYTVAPTEWRLLHDHKFEGVTYDFDNHEGFLTPSVASLGTVRKSFNATTDLVPRLYFTKPKQLIKILEDMRAQSLYDTQMHALRTDITKTLVKNKEYLKHLTSKEAEKWQEKIDIFEKNIKVLKEQEVIFKCLFDNILTKNFYKLYASYNSSKLLQCLQDVNSAVINDPKMPSDSLLDLAREVENLYMELMSQLDTLDPQTAKAVKNKVFAESLQTVKRAKLSRRQLRELDIFKNKLYASFEPSRCKKISDKKKSI